MPKINLICMLIKQQAQIYSRSKIEASKDWKGFCNDSTFLFVMSPLRFKVQCSKRASSPLLGSIRTSIKRLRQFSFFCYIKAHLEPATFIKTISVVHVTLKFSVTRIKKIFLIIQFIQMVIITSIINIEN